MLVGVRGCPVPHPSRREHASQTSRSAACGVTSGLSTRQERPVSVGSTMVEPIFSAHEPPDRRPTLGYAMTVAAALLFGLNGVVSKVVLSSGLGSLRLSEVRSTGAAVGLLLGLAVLAPGRLRLRRGE